MGDAGEGLIDAEARIQERQEELEQERAQKHLRTVRDPARVQAVESLRLARRELERQLAATVHEGRRGQIAKAIEEVNRRMAETSALMGS